MPPSTPTPTEGTNGHSMFVEPGLLNRIDSIRTYVYRSYKCKPFNRNVSHFATTSLMIAALVEKLRSIVAPLVSVKLTFPIVFVPPSSTSEPCSRPRAHGCPLWSPIGEQTAPVPCKQPVHKRRRQAHDQLQQPKHHHHQCPAYCTEGYLLTAKRDSCVVTSNQAAACRLAQHKALARL